MKKLFGLLMVIVFTTVALQAQNYRFVNVETALSDEDGKLKFEKVGDNIEVIKLQEYEDSYKISFYKEFKTKPDFSVYVKYVEKDEDTGVYTYKAYKIIDKNFCIKIVPDEALLFLLSSLSLEDMTKGKPGRIVMYSDLEKLMSIWDCSF